MNVTVTLAPLDSTALDKIRAWRNDHRIWQWCRQNDLITDVSQKAWFERVSKDSSTKMYLIRRVVGDHAEDLGVCGLSGIDLLNRRAEFSIYVDPSKHKQGIGRAALGLLLRHGFLNYGLNVIWGETFDGNPAYKLFEALGFEKEGTRRQFYMRDGRFIDAHLYSISSEKWLESQNTLSL